MAKQLTYLSLDNIGFNGLNTQSNPLTLNTTWLTRADNVVVKESGRLSSRKGLVQEIPVNTNLDENDNPLKIGAIAEYDDNGTDKIFASSDDKIYTLDFNDTDNAYDTSELFTGAGSDWQFINFNRKMYAVQIGQTLLEYSSSTWSAITNKPSDITTFDPSCGMGYYGRLWVGGLTEENDVMYYSDTLIPTTWYNTTPISSIEPSINYTILSVEDDAVSAVTLTIGYKITKFKELVAVTDALVYEIVSDVREVEDTTIGSGLYYEIGFTEDDDWSSVGGPSSAKVGDVFLATGTDITGLGVVRLTWLNLGGENDSKVGDRFTASAADADISEYGAVRLGDWSSFGGSANPELGDLFTATATQSISDYGEVTHDWQVIGGPEIANVNDTFISDSGLSSSTDISAYGTVHVSYGAAGYIDLKTVWGTDEIVAIAPFYGQLVIFGKHNIAIYNNPSDPNAGTTSPMALTEVIRGIGCVSRDSVQAVGDDLIFVSDTGVRSLSRTTELDKVPLVDLSVNVKDTLIRDVGNSHNIKSCYVEDEGVYIMSFADKNNVYIFDMKHITENGAPRITTWSFTNKRWPSSMAFTRSKGFLVGQEAGSIASYIGYIDKDYDTATSHTTHAYTTGFTTTWITLGDGVAAALLKKFKVVFSGGSSTDAGIKWYKDLDSSPYKTSTIELRPSTSGIPSYFGESEFTYSPTHTNYDENSGDTIYEFGASFGLKEYSTPLSGSAKYLQIGMDILATGHVVALQDLTLLFKQGKIR